MDVLSDFEGVLEKGEMLLVLGPPGSGCSTLLKSLSGESSGLHVAPESYINFRGSSVMFISRLKLVLTDVRVGPY